MLQNKRRIMADISSIKRDGPALGIFYESDPVNMSKGKAMIIGPKDTPYEDGFFFFEIQLPSTYPMNPPIVKFITGNGNTRFHPNLYVEGKVCLSILGTWAGEPWSPMLGILQVFITIQSLLDNCPLRHEPAYNSEPAKSPKMTAYNKHIKYAVYETAILNQLQTIRHPEFANPMHEHFQKNKEAIIMRCKALATEVQGSDRCNIYNFVTNFDYTKIIPRLIELV